MILDIANNNRVTHIVSLGKNCMVAYQIRRFFGVEKSYPLDWWITPFDGLIKFLEFSDVNNLFDADQIAISENGQTIMNPQYGICYHHDFKREGPDNRISKNFIDQVGEVKEKYHHVINNLNLLDTNSNSVVFIRSINYNDDLKKLTSVLGLKFRNADFSVLSINPKIQGVGSNWQGDNKEWDEFFISHKLHDKFQHA
jgi:hypothetical protein